MLKLLKLFLIMLSSVDYITSSVTENWQTLPDGLKKRIVRSPNCGGNCNSQLIKNVQEFHGPVVFNTYLSSCSSCTDSDCLKDCNSTNPKPPSKPGNKTKTFRQIFETDKFGLDLYYLIDGTGTFKDSRQKLAAKATDFIDSFKNVSKDYYIGLGAFVDKKGSPQDVIQKREVDGGPGYGLWNAIPLTNQLQDFSKKVDKIKTSSSGQQEDILTALHQSAICQSEIGWRQKTKRFLLLTTDEQYYEQGAKKLGGDGKTPTTPFDGKCHLNKLGIYNGSEYDNVDYPNLGQVKSALYDGGINVIFAIGQTGQSLKPVSKLINLYKDLASQIIPKPFVHPLDPSSPNVISEIIDIIKKSYDEEGKSVNIQTKLSGDAEHVKNVVFTAKCSTKSLKVSNDNDAINEVCDAPNGGKVEYQVTVTLPCPWTYNDVALSCNVLGQSDGNLDLSSVCS